MRIPAFLAWAFAVALFGSSPVHAEKRVALVVGNDRYANLPADQQLRKAANDARAVGDALARIGFEVMRGENLDRRAMVDKLDDLTQRLAAGDTAFFFFAGHGVAIGGANYILPADVPNVEAGQDTRLARASLGESDIVSDLQARGVRVAVVVLDACRNNPFRQPGVRGVGGERGLGRIEPVRGVFTLYSAGIGQTALDRLGDGDSNPNSVFTRVFVPELTKPGLDLQNLAGEVREEVARLASSVQHDQRPAYYDETIGGRVYLAGPPKGDEARTGVVQPAASIDPCVAAADHWRGTESIGTIAAYEDHVARFPTCAYVGLAQIQIARLKKAEVAMVVPPIAPPKPSGGCDGGLLTASLASRPPCPLTAAEERALKPQDSFKECDKCPEMVVVPPGRFTMGSSPRESEREGDEGPQHPVNIANAFAMSKFHVTVDQFSAFVAETGYKAESKCFTAEGGGHWSVKETRSWRNTSLPQSDSHPVVCVSWEDSKAYIAWLNKKTGKEYRLLSEAEWEYAARAGTSTPFWWGRTISSSQANYNGNYGWGGTSEWRRTTVPEDSFQPNAFDIYQVHGNAYQWVEDCWHDSYSDAPNDGSAWKTGDCSRHVVRGGAWYYQPGHLRSAFRDKIISDYRDYTVGIRVARTLARR